MQKSEKKQRGDLDFDLDDASGVVFGDGSPTDWRKNVDARDGVDDDEPRPTPPDVIEMLGYDPDVEWKDDEDD